MSSKISALPSASVANDADLLTVVQGGVNKKTLRPTILTPVSGEQIGFTPASGFMGFDTSHNAEITIIPGLTFKIFDASGNILTIDSSSNWTFTLPSGKSFTISDGTGALIQLAAESVTIEHGGIGNIVIHYDDPTPANWAGVPTDLITAVNRLAAAVAGLLGVPIP